MANTHLSKLVTYTLPILDFMAKTLSENGGFYHSLFLQQPYHQCTAHQ